MHENILNKWCFCFNLPFSNNQTLNPESVCTENRPQKIGYRYLICIFHSSPSSFYFLIIVRIYPLVPVATITILTQARVICSPGVTRSPHLISTSILPSSNPSAQSNWNDPLQNSNHILLFSLKTFKGLLVHRIMKNHWEMYMPVTGLSILFSRRPLLLLLFLALPFLGLALLPTIPVSLPRLRCLPRHSLYTPVPSSSLFQISNHSAFLQRTFP